MVLDFGNQHVVFYVLEFLYVIGDIYFELFPTSWCERRGVLLTTIRPGHVIRLLRAVGVGRENWGLGAKAFKSTKVRPVVLPLWWIHEEDNGSERMSRDSSGHYPHVTRQGGDAGVSTEDEEQSQVHTVRAASRGEAVVSASRSCDYDARVAV